MIDLADKPPHTTKKRKPPAMRNPRPLTSIPTVALLAALALSGCGEPTDQAPEPLIGVPGRLFVAVCKDGVRNQLKSPSTAVFPLAEIVRVGSGYEGAVDAQNGFGATVRLRWTCTQNGAAPYIWVKQVN